MKVGVVFASTGGHKMVRALRSLRLGEPDIPVHIVLDVSSNTYKEDKETNYSWFEQQGDTKIREIQNTGYINGALNIGMRWMQELGCEYGCLFHDDVIFSPLRENRGHLSSWFSRLAAFPELSKYPGLTLSLMQAFIPEVWRRSPADWGSTDLESEALWRQLLPEGKPFGKLSPLGADELHFPLGNFYVQYHVVESMQETTRLGPSGQIVSIAAWNAIGGFDEKDGIFYDIEFPAACVMKNLPMVQYIPSIPHLHLHNQSIGYADLASGIWNDTAGAFKKKYGEKFWDNYFERKANAPKT